MPRWDSIITGFCVKNGHALLNVSSHPLISQDNMYHANTTFLFHVILGSISDPPNVSCRQNT